MGRLPSIVDVMGGPRTVAAPQARTIGVFLSFTQTQQPKYVVSEVFSQDVIVRWMICKVEWPRDPTAVQLQFLVTTGVGVNVSLGQVRDEWDEIVPLRWEGGKAAMGSQVRSTDFILPVGRRYTGVGRRFGVWGMMTGLLSARLWVWLNLEEVG